MQELRTAEQEAAEDIFFGQVVIIIARYFLIGTALFTVLFTLKDPGQLVLAVLPVAALLVMNFFLHGSYMVERPAGYPLVILTSALDIFIITLLVLFWPGSRGLSSPVFVFYYPAIAAFGFVVSRRIEFGYTALAILAYGGASLIIDPTLITNVLELKVLVIRLITFGAMGGLANYYFRIQRDRRRAIYRVAPNPPLGSGPGSVSVP